MSSFGTPSAGRRSSRRLVSHYLEDARRVQREERPASLSVFPPHEGPIDRARVRELVEPHLFFVVQVASEFQSREVPFEDLLAEGNMGLVEAAHRYDPAHEVKFLTYAAWWIRKRILDYLCREGRSVRLTRYARERRRDLRLIEESLRSELGRPPTVEELALRAGLSLETVVHRSGGEPRVLSLDQDATSEGGLTVLDRLACPRSPSPEDQVDRHRVRSLVRREVALLSERQRVIILNRFGLDGRPAMTFQELGEMLGLSRERARQIEEEAMVRLRRRLARVTGSGEPRNGRNKRPSPGRHIPIE